MEHAVRAPSTLACILDVLTCRSCFSASHSASKMEPLHAPPVVAVDSLLPLPMPADGLQGLYRPPAALAPTRDGGAGTTDVHVQRAATRSANEGIELKKADSNPRLGQFHLNTESRKLVQPHIGKPRQQAVAGLEEMGRSQSLLP